jgi:hypothetical protein
MSGRVDLTEFHATMKKQLELTSRTLPEALNRIALDVVNEAYKLTPKASREKIQESLGAKVVAQTVGKNGKIRRKFSYKAVPVVYLIINGMRKKKGLPPVKPSEMPAAQKKLVGSRLRAINSLKSGWVGTLKALIRATRQGMNIDGARPVKMAGRANPAKPGWKPFVEMIYRLTIKKKGSDEYILDPRMDAVTQAAFDAKTKDMKGYIERKLQQQFNTK